MAELNKQVWISQIKQNYYPTSLFLNYAVDMSGLVDNDKINLASAGVDPDVLINNTVYPIPVSDREDTPLEIELDLFETENTYVSKPMSVELAYDKVESVIYGHRMSLRTKTAIKAAHAFAPQENTPSTPVIVTTGPPDRTGRLRLTVEDILELKSGFDDMDYPEDKRFLNLAPKHVEDLILYDLKSFKNITDIVNGQPNRFAGFQMLGFTKPALYNFATKQKKAYGAVAAPATDTFCSFAFYGDEVMKADGEIGMYYQMAETNPRYRRTEIGFDKRFIAVPFRNKGIGAIISSLS